MNKHRKYGKYDMIIRQKSFIMDSFYLEWMTLIIVLKAYGFLSNYIAAYKLQHLR